MIRISVQVNLPDDVADWLHKFNLERGGAVQQAINASVIRYNIPYVPMDTGWLAESAWAATDLTSEEVIYPGPYAHYQYYGEVYGPNIPIFEDDTGIPTGFFSRPGEAKVPTGRALQYNTDVNPLAGAFWFERMKADHLDDIIEEAKNVALGK